MDFVKPLKILCDSCGWFGEEVNLETKWDFWLEFSDYCCPDCGSTNWRWVRDE